MTYPETDSAGNPILTRDALPPLLEKVVHPFAKGDLTTDGVQYTAHRSPV